MNKECSISSTPGKQDEAPTVQESLSILVVEDNDDFRDLLCEMLRMLGHEVICEAGGEPALAALQAQEVDVLITDITLPGMSGMDLARQARSARPSLKIILSSGYGLPPGAKLDFKAGILSKPYSLNQLTKALQEISA